MATANEVVVHAASPTETAEAAEAAVAGNQTLWRRQTPCAVAALVAVAVAVGAVVVMGVLDGALNQQTVASYSDMDQDTDRPFGSLAKTMQIVMTPSARLRPLAPRPQNLDPQTPLWRPLVLLALALVLLALVGACALAAEVLRRRRPVRRRRRR